MNKKIILLAFFALLALTLPMAYAESINYDEADYSDPSLYSSDGFDVSLIPANKWGEVDQSQIPADQINKIPADKVDVARVQDKSRLNAAQLNEGSNLEKAGLLSELDQQELNYVLKDKYGIRGGVDFVDGDAKIEGDTIINGGDRIPLSELKNCYSITSLPGGGFSVSAAEGQKATVLTTNGDSLIVTGDADVSRDDNGKTMIHTDDRDDKSSVQITTGQGIIVDLKGDLTIISEDDLELGTHASLTLHDEDPAATRTMINLGENNLPVHFGTDKKPDGVTIDGWHVNIEGNHQLSYETPIGTWAYADRKVFKDPMAELTSFDAITTGTELYAASEGTTTGNSCGGGSGKSLTPNAIYDITGREVQAAACTARVDCTEIPLVVQYTNDRGELVATMDLTNIADKVVHVDEINHGGTSQVEYLSNTYQDTRQMAYHARNEFYVPEPVEGTSVFSGGSENLIRVNYERQVAAVRIPDSVPGIGGKSVTYTEKGQFYVLQSDFDAAYQQY